MIITSKIKVVVPVIFVLLAFAKVNAQPMFYSQNVLQKLYEQIPGICRIDTVTTDTIVLCRNMVQNATVPVMFLFDENRVLEHIGYPFLSSDDAAAFNNHAVVRFIERELLAILLTTDVNQTFRAYRENGITVLLNDKPLKPSTIQNKESFLNLLKTCQGMIANYDGKNHEVVLLFKNKQKLSFNFPDDTELLTGMNKKERDICLAVQLKNHKAKPGCRIEPDYSYLQLLNDSVYVEKGSSFMIPQINNDIFYKKIDTTYSLVFDRRLLAETFSNALVVPCNRVYTINITHRMYGNQKKKYTVSSRDFDDYFRHNYERYFGIKTAEKDKLAGTLILLDRNVGCIHLASVAVSSNDLLNGGTMEMQLYSNIPIHNLKTLFGQ